MSPTRELHTDFIHHLKHKDQPLVDLFLDLRSYILNIYPDANELLYHTHALTAVYTVADKMAEGFCHVAIYSEHLNLGFNKGTLLDDPGHLLQGTGKLIRHIPIKTLQDYQNDEVRRLIKNAIEFEAEDLETKNLIAGQTISRIKTFE